jgi:cell shape-determining protein MreC
MKQPSLEGQPSLLVTLSPILIVICLLLSEYVGLVTPIRRWGEQLYQPLWQVGSSVYYALSSPLRWSSSSAQAARRIQDLEFRYSEALAQLSELQRLKEENEALRILVENSPRSEGSRLVTAPILSYGTPYVGVGSQEGAQPGAVVLAASTLVGMLDQVSEHQSQVRLLTHAQAQPLLAVTESGVEGVVKGTGSRVVLTEIAKDATLTVGERVVTAGQKGIDGDIFIGRVSSITNEPSASTQTAVIEQLITFYETKVVEIYK